MAVEEETCHAGVGEALSTRMWCRQHAYNTNVYLMLFPSLQARFFWYLLVSHVYFAWSFLFVFLPAKTSTLSPSLTLTWMADCTLATRSACQSVRWVCVQKRSTLWNHSAHTTDTWDADIPQHESLGSEFLLLNFFPFSLLLVTSLWKERNASSHLGFTAQECQSRLIFLFHPFLGMIVAGVV